jgi:membrane dipeptidase
MLIFDGDYPMAFGAIDLNRDLTLSIEAVRAATERSPMGEQWPASGVMASLPEMRRGRIAAALVKIVGRIHRPGNPLWGYRSGEIAYAAAQAHLAYYRILEKRGEARILQTREDLKQHIAAWLEATDVSTELDTSYENLPVGMVLGMEGADPILWPEQVHEWWESGVRVVSLAHYGVSTYAHGTGTPGGLLPAAKPLLREMEALGMILDLTHTSDEAFWQALDLFAGPVLASHQNCRALVPGERQFSDEQIKAILERGAVIGTSMDMWMLYPAGNPDWGATQWPDRRSVFPREAVTLEHVADHIDHVCQLAGNSQHAAIGGDTDGQGGKDGAPYEIDTVADYQKLAGVLERRGYAEEDIANVMYRNWQRFYERWLPA